VEWTKIAIDFLGYTLAKIIVGILLSPFLVLYAFFRMLFPEKPKPPEVRRAPQVQNVTAQRRVMVIEEEIVIRPGATRQAMPHGKVYRHVETVSPEVAERLYLELIREKEQRDARR
jgi:hypothetical protein